MFKYFSIDIQIGFAPGVEGIELTNGGSEFSSGAVGGTLGMNINSAVNAVRQGGASGKGLDMNNRDPNNVNSHIQVIRAYQYGNKVSLKITVD